jgi:hypothetical protein
MAAHKIDPKGSNMDHGLADLDQRLLQIDGSASNLLLKRISKAAQNPAKSFELEIENHSAGSFFDICRDMKNMDDDEFLKASQDLAYLLASCQKRNSIPGGYLIVIDAVDRLDNAVYIAIKAELQEALRYEWTSKESTLRLLDDIFLSPGQKLFKIGIIFERLEEEYSYPNNEFGCFLYDEQFRIDSVPAEFFYKDFLGFSTFTNGKIQSKRFYEATSSFISNNFVEEPEKKSDLLKALKQEFMANPDEYVKPVDFANSYFDNPEKQVYYNEEVAPYLPQAIAKDYSLIKGKLERKKLLFPNDILVSGPEKTFDFSVQIIRSKEELEELDFEKESFTLIKISGSVS